MSKYEDLKYFDVESEDYINPAKKYYGKTIRKLCLYDDYLIIEFDDGIKIKIQDNGSQCCEERYMKCDDNLNDIKDCKLKHILIKDGPTLDWDGNTYVDIRDEDDRQINEPVKEIQFLEIGTDNDYITISNYNKHNGYYEGFLLEIEEIS